jgi:hypothetical protein
LPVQWCSNLIKPQAFLGFNIGGQIFVVHIWNLVDGSWMKGSRRGFQQNHCCCEKILH